MSQQIYFDEQAGVVFIHHDGVVSYDAIVASTDDINGLAGIKPGFGIVNDFRDCSGSNLSVDDIHKITGYVNIHAAWRGPYKVAQIVASELNYGNSRMNAASVDEKVAEIGVFKDVAPALEWVGLPAGYKLPF